MLFALAGMGAVAMFGKVADRSNRG